MKIVTVWESQMQYWGGYDGEHKLMFGRSRMFYLFKERADQASPGGPPIERKILERDGLYFMMRKPWYGEVSRDDLADDEIMNVAVFTDEKYSENDNISSLSWEEEITRLGRTP